MAGCDIVVHCSLRPEPLGMVVPEAMALGRAVVASRTRGPEEVVAQGRTGMLVPPGDERALAATISALVADGELRARLGTAGEAEVRANRSASVMAEKFAQLYANLS
jgi:glycosyltransferase involved in cell wall biosynthesis